MSKLGDQLRAHGVHNTHELLKRFGDRGPDIAIDYTPYEARAIRFCGTRVWSPSFKTDPHSHWSDHGTKFFGGGRAASWPLALKWAEEKCGVNCWGNCPLLRGTWVPKYVLDRAKKFLKDKAKEVQS